ncbi:unnamed protein product [Oikopleura dioica]|uniref:Uncharacterized protein n=1 Tax=Oikopleura dioica TaxID=34765 RepID=E4YMC2_OIKDI|nr:unnamed protein product [Oikopleura dioica]
MIILPRHLKKSDAKFRCPVKCGADNLSFDQFTVGTCCEAASRWTGTKTFYKISLLNRLYAESRYDEGDAETKVETADKKVESCRKALEEAEIDGKNARDELGEKKKWRRKVQARFLFMASVEMKQDNVDKVENGDQNLEERNETNTDGETCKVCQAFLSRPKWSSR